MMIPPPFGLACEALRNPVGIDARRPRLSWKLEHRERGQTQTAVRIIVGSSPDSMKSGADVIWDSGKRPSDGSTHVRYAGQALESRKRYFWKIRWWDKKDRAGDFSEAAFFEMGLLDDSDWRADWISAGNPRFFRTRGTVLSGKYRGDYIQTEAMYFVKEFEAQPGVIKARTYICGLGFFELVVNGRKVGDHVLDPGQTDYKKTALYVTHDITERLERRNSVIIVLGNGRHIKNFGYGPPKAICQIEIEYENGRRQVVVTDETWPSGRGPIRENGIYFGQILDARRENFERNGKAVRVSGPPLCAQMCPPIRVVQRLPPRRIFRPSSGVFICDFGQNFAGWVRLRAKGRTGTKIILRHAELLNGDGTLNASPNQGARAEDIFILKGRGVEAHEPRFTYHGFRYVELSGYPGTPRLEDIEGCVAHSDVEPDGEFRCSHPLFNRIHRNIVWGQRSNLMSLPTDCPQRDERHGWLGDAHLAAEEAIFNFDMESFYAKFLRDIRNAQDRRGRIPDFVPPYVSGFSPADPAWGSAYITLAWLLYWHYGNTDVLAEHFEGLKKYVDFLAENAEGGILKNLGKYGDWCPPGSIVPKKTPLELTSTWYYYHDTLLLAKIAEVLNRTEDAKKYAKSTLRIKDAFNKKFLEGDQYASIRTSPVDKYVSQTSNVLPLYLRMTPAGKKAAVLRSLLRSIIDDWDYHLDTGILGTRYLLEVLSDNGRADVAYRIASQTTYPGWGYMIKEGATTLWERWEKNTGGGMNSHNHIMLGSIDAWFYKTIAGIRCLAPGWKSILIAPPGLPALGSAECSLRTVRGRAAVHWIRRDNDYVLDIRIPVGAEAEVRLPLLWKKSRLTEGGTVLWRNGKCHQRPAEIKFSKAKSDRLILKILSGTYRFRLEESD
ncbi:MAG: family 78 glycoside hydrolase catalytic domain [Candidatus Aminicenantales bacterium]